ncbi:hypothetical protein H5410_037332 [Solanum commersonii]|uniref:Uncharacterized protein n=1 Tax=Solanum commersonii TaxID=4109 RepID=A0A9J5Y9W8_SOLCO|nr:hypothetical protein H5410_037332 [Solanum commersonii]
MMPSPRPSPLDMMQKGSWSILDRDFYEKYESKFEEGEGEGALDPQEDLFNHIVWAPRIWHPWGFLFDCIEGPMNWDFLLVQSFRASGSFMMKRMSFKRRFGVLAEWNHAALQTEIDLPKNKAFLNKPIHFGPRRSTLFLFKDQPRLVFSHRELFADEEMSKGLLTSQTDPPTSIYKRRPGEHSGATFRTAAESMGRQERTRRTERS